MSRIDEVFDRLDDWRKLPSYQLERRADIFFSLYLPEVLKKQFGREFKTIIPEFPVAKKLIVDGHTNNDSYRIDYLAVSKNRRKKSVLVELKTDSRSLKNGQCKYLAAASRYKLKVLVDSVRTIMAASRAKGKYLHLLSSMEAAGLVSLPNKPTPRDVLAKMKNTAPALSCDVVIIKPCGSKTNGDCRPVPKDCQQFPIMYFEDVRSTVLEHKDRLSQRFAKSLEKWDTD